VDKQEIAAWEREYRDTFGLIRCRIENGKVRLERDDCMSIPVPDDAIGLLKRETGEVDNLADVRFCIVPIREAKNRVAARCARTLLPVT
jgi:hypothetical protein